MRATHLLSLIYLGLLAGCANPMLKIDSAGFSTSKESAARPEPRSMEEAMAKLNLVRATYYEAIADQVGQSQNAVTGLVWLGSAIVGMAAGDTHRDAILGTALVGGTTYGLARTQLDSRRLDIWLSGMEALDCAKEAALPADIGADRVAEIRASVAAVREAQGAVRKAVLMVRERASKAEKGDITVQPALNAAANAEQAVENARVTVAAALGLLDAARGGELSVAVDRIHTGVTKAMKDVAVDPSSIKQLVAGIGGFAEILAPGTGIESQLSEAMGKYRTAKAEAQADQLPSSPELAEATAQLDLATRSLAAAQTALSALVGDVNVGQVAAALKKCGVTPPSTALVLTPGALSFEQGMAATRGFTIEGGSMPYEVSALDVLPDGIAPIFRGGLADTAQVKVGDKVPAGVYQVLISDSKGKKKILTVTVAGKTAAGATAKPNVAAPGDVTKAWEALKASITKPDFTGQIGSVTFTVESAELSGNKLKVKLNCSKADAGLDALKVREKLTAADKQSVQVLMQAGELDDNFTQIDLSPSGPCVRG